MLWAAASRNERGCLPHLSELIQRLNDLGAIYEQDYTEGVVLTRASKVVMANRARSVLIESESTL